MPDVGRAAFALSRSCAENRIFAVVGAGDSPVRGNVRAADKRVPESGGSLRPPADRDQTSAVRGQKQCGKVSSKPYVYAAFRVRNNKKSA